MRRTSPRLAALLLLLGAAAGASAQSDDAARGRDLWADTPGVSGINTLTASCTNCHTVDQRRQQISGVAGGPGVFADISFDTAMTRFTQALANQSAMQTFQQLPLQDVRDLATYIADTPKTTVAALDFTASATNTTTAAQSVDLRHSVAPLAGSTLSVTGVAISGSGASSFALQSNACNNATLAASNTCRVNVTFNAADTAGKSAALTFSLRQGTTNFSRSVALTGAVAVSSPPPAADSGGGALGVPWLAALAAAVTALALSSRSGSGRARRARTAAATRAAR
jgi:cytochrome c553